MNPVEIEFLFRDRLSAGLERAGRSVDALQANAAVARAEADRLQQSISELTARLAALERAGQAASPDLQADERAAEAERLRAKLQELESQLRQVGEAAQDAGDNPDGLKDLPDRLADAFDSLDKGADSLDTVGQKYNGLHMSIQQMAREMPSLAVGPQTFFLAISNNLPVFADELARARREYAALTQAGQRATPVWRQVLTSVFSWQTAMTTGIMLLVMYGKEIGQWVGGLFRSRQQLDLNRASQEALNKARLEGAKNARQETVSLRLLYAATQDHARGMDERLKAVAELQRQYPGYFGNLSSEDILAGRAADAYARLAQSITAAARARAAQDAIVEQQRTVLDNEQKIADAYARREGLERRLAEAEKQAADARQEGLNIEARQFLAETVKSRRTDIDNLDKEIAGYRTAIYQANRISSDLEHSINIGDLLFKPGGGSGDGGSSPQTDNLKAWLDSLTRLREENEDRQVELMDEGTERELAAIDLRYRRIRERIRELEAGLQQAQGGRLTPEQRTLFADARANVDRSQQRDTDAVTTAADRAREQAEADALSDYLRQYGDYQQQREAIAREYAGRIARAETEGERLSLEKQLQDALEDVDISELKDGLDWEAVFGDLDRTGTEALTRLRDRLKEFIATQKDLSPENLKELMDAVRGIGRELDSRHPFRAMATSFRTLTDASERAHEAQEAYNRAVREGTAEEQAAARATLEIALSEKRKAQAEATRALHAGVSRAREYLSAADDVRDILGAFHIEPPKWLDGYLDGVGKTLDGLEKIDLTQPATLITGGIKALSGMVDTVTSLGGIINWSGSNAREVQKTIDRLTERNTLLQQSIEDLTDTIRGGEGTRSVSAYERAVEYQREQDRNYLDIARTQAGYHGSHHSWAYYWRGFSDADVRKLSRQMGRDWNGDLWNLSPEEMKLLRSNVDMWEQIRNTGKGGYGERLAEKLNDYIDQAGKLEALTAQLHESLTQISFDSMYDSFVDTLMDMDASAEEIAGNVGKYFMRALLANQVGEQYKDRLKQWYEGFADAMRDNDLSTDEVEDLSADYRRIVEDAVALRDRLAHATGYDRTEETGSRQSGRPGSFNAMSQEQGTKLEGMFTSGLMHWASMDSLLSDIGVQMSTATDNLRRIEEHTGCSARLLGEVKEDIRRIIRDGLKVK